VLFHFLFHKNRLVVMRSADAIEKITVGNLHYLEKHRKEVLDLCRKAKNKELKWHLALLIPRLQLEIKEFDKAFDTLTSWAADKTNSRIVRVNSIQGLFEMTKDEPDRINSFVRLLAELEKENIPSINARIKIIKKEWLAK
jgi:hypothetical protein